MSNLLFELREMINKQAGSPGRVISVSGSSARVATYKGVQEVLAEGAYVGDSVMVRDGRAVKVQGSEGIQVYFV